MATNPEILRHAWTDLTIHRMVAMPIMLSLIFLVAAASEGFMVRGAVATTAAILFIALTIFWGAREAADCVTREVRVRTWDWQRTSSISAWTLSWGKVAGSTAYSWYGGVMCLAAFTVGALRDNDAFLVLQTVTLLIGFALLFQWVALVSSLMIAASGRVTERKSSLVLLFFFVIAIGPLTSLFTENVSDQVVLWFNMDWTLYDFALLSVVLWLFWAVVGAWHLMRVELQFRNQFWAWLAFLIFCGSYVAGFGTNGEGQQMLIAYSVVVVVTWFSAFTETKDPVAWRAFLLALTGTRWGEIAELMPRWLVGLLLSAVLAALVITLLLTEPLWLDVDSTLLSATVIAVLMFVVRDIGILLLLSLSRHITRPEFVTFIYLLVLYAVLPWLFALTGLEDWTVLFWPFPRDSVVMTFVPALIEAVLVIIVLRRQWRLRYRTVSIGHAEQE